MQEILGWIIVILLGYIGYNLHDDKKQKETQTKIDNRKTEISNMSDVSLANLANSIIKRSKHK